jgi:hypothetical protein
MLEIAVESELFEPAVLRSDVWANGRARPAIIKLGAVAIHVACASGQRLPSSPRPLFLADGADDVS